MSTPQILFVCTGNICRSAMAEAIARDRFESIHFSSAGTHAIDGNAAFGHSATAASEIGVDLSKHRAQLITEEMMRNSSKVYALDAEHVDALAERFATFADKVELLDPAGDGIEDPYGTDLDAHRRVRDRIAASIDARTEEWSTV
ncbi:MAG: low molecular weight protein arginine phosphatase [Acidimicrobiia bacterium]|nr:low molecular weight protein arginine phosphatase [Acidimicrobiia bacterium]